MKLLILRLFLCNIIFKIGNWVISLHPWAGNNDLKCTSQVMEIQLGSCVHREITVLLLISGEPLNPQVFCGCAGRQVHFTMMSIDTLISNKQDKDEKVNAEISEFPHKFPILWDFLAEMDWMKDAVRIFPWPVMLSTVWLVLTWHPFVWSASWRSYASWSEV